MTRRERCELDTSRVRRSRLLMLVWAFGAAMIGVVCLLRLTSLLAKADPCPSAVPAPFDSGLFLRVPSVFTYPLTTTLNIRDTFGPQLSRAGVYSRYGFRLGVNWLADEGMPVHAVTTGTVYSFRGVGMPGASDGGFVHLVHEGADCQTLYGNLAAVSAEIIRGVQVVPGQVIGWVGDDAAGADSYLHFEVHEGTGITRCSAIHPLSSPFLPWTNHVSPSITLDGVYTDVTGMTALIEVTSPCTELDVVSVGVIVSGTFTDARSCDYVRLIADTPVDATVEDPFVNDVCIIPRGTSAGEGYRVAMAFRGLDHGSPATVTAWTRDVEGWGSAQSARSIGGLEVMPPEQTTGCGLGQSVAFSYTLTNRSGTVDTFTLTHLSAQGWPALVTPPTVTLRHGRSATVTVAITVSADRLGPPDCGLLLAESEQGDPRRLVAGFYRLYRDAYVSAEIGSDITGTGSRVSPFATIGHAISQTYAGGTIHVAQGTYAENLTLGKVLSILGGYDASAWATRLLQPYSTVVDGQGLDSVLAINVEDRRNVTVEGLTLVNGCAETGGGIRLVGSAPIRLRSNWILSNTADGNGGGIYVDVCSGTVTLIGNTIISNVAESHGGGIAVAGGTVYAQNDVIAKNSKCRVDGTGIYLSQGDLLAQHWTLASNGAAALAAVNGGSAALSNTIVADHLAGFYAGLDGSDVIADHTLFFSSTERCTGRAICTNNLEGNPRFVDAGTGDYHIGPDSAAFDTGLGTGVTTDMDGEPRPLCSNPDIGADELMPSRPLASFASSSPDWLGQETTFSNTTIFMGCADYVWDFGDGKTCFSEDPTHTYSSPGVYTVVLAAANWTGSSVATDTVEIYSPPDHVVITGPTQVRINTSYVFTAAVRPITATSHITYVWQATGHEPVMHPDVGLTDSTAFTWTLPGSQVVTVTATNPGATVADSLSAAAVAAAFPFSDSFELGRLGWPWSVSTTLQGRVAITNTYEPCSECGSYSVLLDDPGRNNDIRSTAALILNVDLAGRSGVELDFWWKAFDEDPGDEGAVYIRNDDTVPWSKVFTLTVSDDDDDCWHNGVIYLDSAASVAGTPFSDRFQIMFRARVNWDAPEDGYIIDKIQVKGVPVEGMEIGGPEVVTVNEACTFTANVRPPTATRPISYVWSPEPSTGQGEGVAVYTWGIAGWQTLVCTATHADGVVSDTHYVHVVMPVGDVEIEGPDTGIAGTAYTFTADVSPSTATSPISHVWSPEPSKGQGGTTATYAWDATGPHTIVCTATNPGGSCTDKHVIDISIPVGDVRIDGPITGSVGADCAFTATVGPPTATLPVTYSWQATKQDDVLTMTNALTHTVRFSWDMSGVPCTISVTAINAGGAVTASHFITTEIGPGPDRKYTFCPIVLQQWPLRTPVLKPIVKDSRNDYTVSWIVTTNAMTYVLEEAMHNDAANWKQVYAGGNRSYSATNKGPTRYFYRVKARNALGDSAWSEAETVDVLWEIEPNDDTTVANGPVVSGLTYYGTLESPVDAKDYFFFTVLVTGRVQVWLKNIPAGHNYSLSLFDETGERRGYSGNPGNSGEYIDAVDLERGLYYVQVYGGETAETTGQSYCMQVVYPQCENSGLSVLHWLVNESLRSDGGRHDRTPRNAPYSGGNGRRDPRLPRR